MKCAAYIDPKTGIALKGEALEDASKNPDAPRCGYELESDDVFCPLCGAKVEHADMETATPENDLPVGRIIGIALGIVIGVVAVSSRIGQYDHTSSVQEYNRGVDKHNSIVYFMRGVESLAGYGVDKDAGEAVSNFRRSANLGNVDAQYNMGVAYEEGKGVEYNDKEAVKWYEKAAEQGDARAQCKLGKRFSRFDSSNRQHKKAFKWFLKAAEQGDAEAQYELGEM